MTVPRARWRTLAPAFALAGAMLVACKTVAPVPEIPAEPPTVVAPPPTVGTPEPTAPAPPATLRIDERVVRFEIVAVEDSLFTIVTGPVSWLRDGMQGIAVDPRRRDALVARFRVLSRGGDSAMAVVTGEAARLTTDHIALLRRPRERAISRSEFWGGVAIGGALTALAIFFATR